MGSLLALAALAVAGRWVLHRVAEVRDARRKTRTARERVERQWSLAVKRFEEVEQEHAAYLFDLSSILEAPLLQDTTDRHTAAFFDARAKVQELHTDRCPDDVQSVEEFDTATEKLRSTWRTARDHAYTVGLTGYSVSQRQSVERARKSFRLVSNPATSEGERQAAWRAVQRHLDGILTVPAKTVAAIETSHRLALAAA